MLAPDEPSPDDLLMPTPRSLESLGKFLPHEERLDDDAVYEMMEVIRGMARCGKEDEVTRCPATCHPPSSQSCRLEGSSSDRLVRYRRGGWSRLARRALPGGSNSSVPPPPPAFSNTARVLRPVVVGHGWYTVG